jgi:hypoxanthine phosphoribosyltransferase
MDNNSIMMTQKKVYLTWDDVNALLDKIHEQCKGKIDYVTGIPRGGTILAIMYSHRFEVPYMQYTSNHYPKLLIIDDIADSGKTIFDLRDTLSNPKFATLHYKTTSVAKPEYFAQEIADDFGWIVYPWEKESSNPIQGYLEE